MIQSIAISSSYGNDFNPGTTGVIRCCVYVYSSHSALSLPQSGDQAETQHSSA